MKAQHTPGPWKHEGQGDITGLENDGDIKGAVDVCCVYLRTLPGRHDANAILIAAAPDLLQELRNIANADTAEWDDKTEFEAWAKNRARAAIAKATGVDQ